MFRHREASESIVSQAANTASPRSPRAEGGSQAKRGIPAKAGPFSDVGVPMWSPSVVRGPVVLAPGGTTRHSVPRAGDSAQRVGPNSGHAPFSQGQEKSPSATRAALALHYHRRVVDDATVVLAPMWLACSLDPGSRNVTGITRTFPVGGNIFSSRVQSVDPVAPPWQPNFPQISPVRTPESPPLNLKPNGKKTGAAHPAALARSVGLSPRPKAQSR